MRALIGSFMFLGGMIAGLLGMISAFVTAGSQVPVASLAVAGTGFASAVAGFVVLLPSER